MLVQVWLASWGAEGRGTALRCVWCRCMLRSGCVKGLDKRQKHYRCAYRVARGKTSFPGGLPFPLPFPAHCWGNLRFCCLLGDSTQLGGCGCVRLAKWRLLLPCWLLLCSGREEEMEEEEGGMWKWVRNVTRLCPPCCRHRRRCLSDGKQALHCWCSPVVPADGY